MSHPLVPSVNISEFCFHSLRKNESLVCINKITKKPEIAFSSISVIFYNTTLKTRFKNPRIMIYPPLHKRNLIPASSTNPSHFFQVFKEAYPSFLPVKTFRWEITSQ
jgi:hypothetical protein